MGDHQLLAAAIWSLLDVEQQNVPDFVGRKLELTNQLKSGQIVDWETYADAVHEIFTNVTYPVTLSIGWTGLQEFINQVMDWSLVPEREQKELVAKMMGIENPESLNMIRGINTDPVSLLLSSPQWISGMTVLLRDLMGMAFKTTEIKGDAVRKLMEAEQETAKLSLHSANELLNELKKAYPRMEKVSAKLAAGIVARLEQEMKDKLENNPIPSSSSHTTHTRNHILPSNQIIDVPPSSKE